MFRPPEDVPGGLWQQRSCRACPVVVVTSNTDAAACALSVFIAYAAEAQTAVQERVATAAL